MKRGLATCDDYCCDWVEGETAFVSGYTHKTSLPAARLEWGGGGGGGG